MFQVLPHLALLLICAAFVAGMVDAIAGGGGLISVPALLLAGAKLLNFASNAESLAVFAISGAIWWAVGLAMGVAQILGAMIGARLAVRVGARVIKPLLVITSTGMALRLLWQGFT